jgi:hypothetical protein
MMAAQRRIALCHLWLRAAEIGDPKAERALREYSADDIAAARCMTMVDAIEAVPEARPKLVKPVNLYGPLPDVDDEAA